MLKRLLALFVAIGVYPVFGQSTNFVNAIQTIVGGINVCGADSGAVNAIACTIPNVPSGVTFALQKGNFYVVTPANSNTASTTAAINGLSGLPIKKNGGQSNLASGDIILSIPIILMYDGTNFDLIGTVANPAASQLHSIVVSVDGSGSVLTTGAVGVFPTVNYNCTINRIDITGSPSGSVTVDVWKANAAIPTSGNKISASAPLTLSSSQLSQAGSLTGWTTSVAVGDVFGFNIATATTTTKITGTIWCQ